MRDGWPDLHDLAKAKTEEAELCAQALGHKLTSWLCKDKDWLSRCIQCSEPVRVVLRGIGGYELMGIAVTFRCSRPA